MSRLFRREQRALTYQSVWGSGGNPNEAFGTGLESSLRVLPVYAATSLIADLVSTLPFHAYEDLGNGQRRRLDDGEVPLVKDPSVFGGRVTWMMQGLTSALLRGNATGLVLDRDRVGTPTKVSWQHPDLIAIDESKAIPLFSVNGRKVPLPDVVHVPGYVLPGSVKGLSPVGLARMTLKSAMRAQEFALAWYENGVAPSAHVRNTVLKDMPPDKADELKQRLKATIANGDPWVTGADWEYQSLTLSPADAMFLDQVKATATQVASLYRLAPEDVGGEAAGSLTYQTLEQNELKTARRALLPWTSRFEDALSALLPQRQFVKFNLDAFSRADLKTRMEAHDLALRAGIETNDEARALEDRPPLTADQIKQWQTLYGPRAAAAAQGNAPTGRTEH